jgi:hypothetical protein
MTNLVDCPVCKRKVEEKSMECHHWKPESHGGTINESMRICGTCHDIVHHIIPIHEIENYKTPQSIRDISTLKPYIEWISDKTHTRNWSLKYIRKNIKF